MTSSSHSAYHEPTPVPDAPSSTPFAPGPQPLFAPGAAYAYWDSAMNMLGLALTRAAGEPLDQLFRRRIADPISLNAAGWR